MKKLCLAAALSLGLVAQPASAQTIDMSKLKCEEFLSSGADNIGVLLMWLSGYYASEDEETTVDFTKMKADGVKIATYCKEHPTSGFLDAAAKALDRDED
jgi:acid stress chaperone HdeB